MNRHAQFNGYIAVLLFCPLLLFAQSHEKTLKKREGFLVVGIKIEGIQFESLSIDGGRSYGFAHTFKVGELDQPTNYKLIALPAGTYYWAQLKLRKGSNYNFKRSAFVMTVKAGHINYGGLFVGESSGGGRPEFRLLNRSSAGIVFIQDCCRRLLDKYPMKFGASGYDPFVDYYLSLPSKSDDDSVLDFHEKPPLNLGLTE